MVFALTGVAVVDGKLYILGGEDGWEHFHDTIECYNPDTNSWTHVGEMLTGRSWLSCAPLRVSKEMGEEGQRIVAGRHEWVGEAAPSNELSAKMSLDGEEVAFPGQNLNFCDKLL